MAMRNKLKLSLKDLRVFPWACVRQFWYPTAHYSTKEHFFSKCRPLNVAEAHACTRSQTHTDTPTHARPIETAIVWLAWWACGTRLQLTAQRLIERNHHHHQYPISGCHYSTLLLYDGAFFLFLSQFRNLNVSPSSSPSPLPPPRDVEYIETHAKKKER